MSSPGPAPSVEPPRGGAELSDQERAILDFERQWWKHAGGKEQAVRDAFGSSPTRYYQQLNALLDSPAALAYEPLLVKRLRRMRASRLATRSQSSADADR